MALKKVVLCVPEDLEDLDHPMIRSCEDANEDLDVAEIEKESELNLDALVEPWN